MSAGVRRSRYYVPGLVRLSRLIGDCWVEVTCAASETGACSSWLEHGAVGPLPVAAYSQYPWTSAYRWTLAADEVWRASREAA
jgi:hypothetical protein